MSISSVHRQWSSSKVVWPGGRECAFPWGRSGTAVRRAVPLRAVGVTDGRGPAHGLPRIGPPLRKGVVGILPIQVIQQPGGTVVDRTTGPAFEKAAGESSAPHLD